MRILDAFCSNGSTGIDKEFFHSKNVVKNDVRNGMYIIGKRQKINIVPNTHFDMFEIIGLEATLMLGRFDVVYLDPPHSLKTSGIMNEKYTHLPKDWRYAIGNMWFNVFHICGDNTIIVLKGNENEISLKKILEIAKHYNIFPLFGSRVRTKTHFVVLRKKKPE